ncbi:MAG TPA: hypothetical protein DEA22_02575 [Blastocatellia bacterium]|nr:hypothetical protein [Blastocatellia bacterium]
MSEFSASSIPGQTSPNNSNAKCVPTIRKPLTCVVIPFIPEFSRHYVIRQHKQEEKNSLFCSIIREFGQE